MLLPLLLLLVLRILIVCAALRQTRPENFADWSGGLGSPKQGSSPIRCLWLDGEGNRQLCLRFNFVRWKPEISEPMWNVKLWPESLENTRNEASVYTS